MHRLTPRGVVPLIGLCFCVGLATADRAHASPAAPHDSIISGVCGDGVIPLGIVPPEGGLQVGCNSVYTLKYGAGHGTRGTYGIVDLPPCDWDYCSRAGIRNRLRCELVHGNPCCTGEELVGRTIPNDPGNRGGLFLPAILQRWWSDTDQRQDICHDVYRGNGRRIVRVVILDQPGARGRAPLLVVGFADFFLRRVPTKPDEDLVGEFLPARAP